MSKNKISGDAGELDVVEKVPCPNCGKKLMILPQNYPLYDVQCVGCNFRRIGNWGQPPLIFTKKRIF